jgi:hypothetical protein
MFFLNGYVSFYVFFCVVRKKRNYVNLIFDSPSGEYVQYIFILNSFFSLLTLFLVFFTFFLSLTRVFFTLSFFFSLSSISTRMHAFFFTLSFY